MSVRFQQMKLLRRLIKLISVPVLLPLTVVLGLSIGTMWVPDLAEQRALAADELTSATGQGSAGTQTATLRDRLVYGLQARLKSEIAFVDSVVLRVRLGQLPQRLVDQTFFWAREHANPNQNGRQERPIIYFQPAMKLRAEKIGVAL